MTSLGLCLTFLSFCFVLTHAQQSIYGLHVVKNQIFNGQGQVIRLFGASRSGAEFACVQGWGIFDGPTDNSSIVAIRSWNINVIRIPLNEDCWLGINGVNPLYSGYNYQSAIIDFVNRLNAYGIAVILDLHWTAPGTNVPYGQQPMPNTDHDIDFWKSVAKTFSSNSAVIFDLFNEPYPDNNQDTAAAWSCMANGGTCSGVWYNAASMQNLVDAVRSTNATNIVLVAGVEYANCLTQWLPNMPKDPLNQLGASWHSYSFNICDNQACWDSQIKPVALQVPVIATEFGENDCSTGYVNPLMNWMDTMGMSYLGWTWNVWDCSSGPALISDYNGTPTNYGQGLYQHLQSIFGTTQTLSE